MAGFTGTIVLLNLDQSALLDALDKKLTEILVKGTTEWVRTVAAIIPNWSGQSRASLKPIADLVGVPIFTSVADGAPDRRAEGEAKGFGKLISESGVYTFAWHSDVFYLAYNEFHDANRVGFHLINPGPYKSQQQAQQSFFKTVNPLLKGLDYGFSQHVHVIRKSLNG